MAVACGYEHTLAVAERGCRVFACGCGDDGRLGAIAANAKSPVGAS